MSHANGTIEATPSHPPTNRSLTLGTWEGTDDGTGTYTFETGPFQLPETGVYRVRATVDEGHRTVPHELVYEGCEEEGGGGEKIEPPIDIG